MNPFLWQSDRRVVLAVTGGIAAYKTPALVRYLKARGCQVRVVLSAAAEAFVSPMVLATLSGERVWRETDFLSLEGGSHIPHIDLAQWAEAILVAPCTAHHLSTAANGQGGSLIDAMLLATRAPVVFFPAMNCHMLAHPAVQTNIATLRNRGAVVTDSDSGDLACGEVGAGRLLEREEIAQVLWSILSPTRDLVGRSVLITAGPTREFLDPVRFVSNPSSGKMGMALAEAALYRGAQVRVILGPAAVEAPHGVTVVPVVSALDMFAAVQERFSQADVIVAAAAVSDYRPESFSEHKIKRESVERVERVFVRNPDIAAWVGAHKSSEQRLVGFAAETEDMLAYARDKMERKNMDFIAANDLTVAGSGFGTDTNDVMLLERDGISLHLSGTKEQVAWGIWDAVAKRLA